jgi:hypothetical protein
MGNTLSMKKTTRLIAMLSVAVLAITTIMPAQTAPVSVPVTKPATNPADGGVLGMLLPTGPGSPVEEYLNRGDLVAAAKAMTDALAANPGDDQSRFSLGVVQFLQGVEHLSQSLYKFGLRTEDGREFMNVPIPDNAKPATISYEDSRKILVQFRADVLKAEATLALVKDPNVKLPIHIGMARLDFIGDGHPSDETTLWKVLANMWHNPDINVANARNFVICFDQGDVYWLRGYCHLLAGLSDVVLAYDEKDLFDHTAHIFFKSVDSPFPFLQSGKKVFEMGGVDIIDVVAFVHLLHFPLKDPLQLLDARSQFKQMIACSRTSWKLILAETDDDHEWIPNPKQHSVLPHVEVNQEMIDAWLKFLDEADDILDGTKLIPFWRGDGTQGVNLAKLFFINPQPFDLVLWIQGTGVAPALEHGKLTDPDVYHNLERVFGGNVFSFGAWFN